MKSQQQYSKTFSCEFFPPKTDQGMEKLHATSQKLAEEINPEYFSVTFGAGGSTRERTFDAVKQINKASGIDVAPHLSCIGSTSEQINEILDSYKNQGIKRIVALRGDIPSGMVSPGEFNYANELVEYIRKTTGDHFKIEVAAYPEFHPQSDSATADLNNFKRKIEAGANSAITQYFYNADAYFQFVESCEKMGIEVPIMPGIMPITNFNSLSRFSDACGAEIPRWLRKRLQAFGDDVDSIKDFGADVVTQMCQHLLDAGAPGLHFYTLNQTEATLRIWNNLSR
ncbi:MAG: methylenetetrahydrofolate reductase [NAD(P)H] [Gammaproteobacteria bacterium]|nr:methylenetetrahydrofolate reductase [NAD(P)H] [Gammaproteobacteria bacterium]MCW9056581.1 methylenetetrahydrofolate reductase [NAD(P)H] [Gammaproteobacteria bacterium]